MEETPTERIVTTVTNVVLIIALLAVGVFRAEFIPFVTGTVGVMLGKAQGAIIAARVRTNTTKKLSGHSDLPPPGAGGAAGGGSDDGPRGRSGAPPATFYGALLVTLACAWLLTSCASRAPLANEPTPREKAYYAGQVGCASTAPSREASRHCRRVVDQMFPDLVDSGAVDAAALGAALDAAAEYSR